MLNNEIIKPTCYTMLLVKLLFCLNITVANNFLSFISVYYILVLSILNDDLSSYMTNAFMFVYAIHIVVIACFVFIKKRGGTLVFGIGTNILLIIDVVVNIIVFSSFYNLVGIIIDAIVIVCVVLIIVNQRKTKINQGVNQETIL